MSTLRGIMGRRQRNYILRAEGLLWGDLSDSSVASPQWSRAAATHRQRSQCAQRSQDVRWEGKAEREMRSRGSWELGWEELGSRVVLFLSRVGSLSQFPCLFIEVPSPDLPVTALGEV